MEVEEERLPWATIRERQRFMDQVQVGDVIRCVQRVEKYNYQVDERYKVIKIKENGLDIQTINNRRHARGSIFNFNSACVGFVIERLESADDAFLNSL